MKLPNDPAQCAARVSALREKLERRFSIRLSDEELLIYLVERALERMEEWEIRTRMPVKQPQEV